MMIVYRLVNEDDAAAFLEFLRTITAETDNLACSADEAAAMTEEDERSFIRGMADSGSFSMAAVADGEICGSCDIRIQGRERLRHRAEMGIAVRKECWGTGIAQHLLEESISEAKRRGVRKIYLTVRSDNERARALYERNGFKLSGTDRMLFIIDWKCIDGEQYDLILE